MATHLGVAIIYTIPSMLFCLLGSLISTVYGEWISPPSTLPSAASDKYVVTGSYNGTIFLLGGDSYPRQTTEYQINTDTFTTTQTLPTDLKGYAQCWTQLKETMYMVEPGGSTLSTFNMITKQYTPTSLHLNTNVGNNGEVCLAVANGHLFITGGWPNDIAMNTVQVLNLTTSEWMMNTQPMQQTRCSHACAAHYNYLWVFGGWGDDTIGAININERIHISGIISNQSQWEFIDPLTTSVYGVRATAWHQSIFVIGGYKGSGSAVSKIDKVHVADAITGKVVVSPDRLVYGIAFHGTVIVQNVIYLLGGGKNTWMYYQLTEPASNPITTHNPTTTDPTTANPTTPAPTSPDPTTADPTTANPTTTDPTTADPTTANPTTTDPTTADP
eukprot:868061_1